MKWLLIVNIMWGDGDHYLGQLSDDEYTEQECKSKVATLFDVQKANDFKVLYAKCLQSTSI